MDVSFGRWQGKGGRTFQRNGDLVHKQYALSLFLCLWTPPQTQKLPTAEFIAVTKFLISFDKASWKVETSERVLENRKAQQKWSQTVATVISLRSGAGLKGFCHPHYPFGGLRASTQERGWGGQNWGRGGSCWLVASANGRKHHLLWEEIAESSF